MRVMKRLRRTIDGIRFLITMMDGPTITWQHQGSMFFAYCTPLGWFGGSRSPRVFAWGHSYAEFSKHLGEAALP